MPEAGIRVRSLALVSESSRSLEKHLFASVYSRSCLKLKLKESSKRERKRVARTKHDPLPPPGSAYELIRFS